MSHWVIRGAEFQHSTSGGKNRYESVKWDQLYLLGICVRLECDVPVVVVRKLNTYHLWTVVVFEQRLHFLLI